MNVTVKREANGETSAFLKHRQREAQMKKLEIYEKFLNRAQNPWVSKHVQVLSNTLGDKKKNQEDEKDMLGPASQKLYDLITSERQFDAYGRPIPSHHLHEIRKY
jgi:hypothetical protein